MKWIRIYVAISLLMIFRTLGYAQLNDTILHHNQTKKIIEIAIPAAFITYGAISLGSEQVRKLDYSVRNKVVEEHAVWNKCWDDYLLFLPAVAAFGIEWGGVESVHKTSDKLILYALSMAVSTGGVYVTKNMASRERPDGSDHFSFPSGHTASAFVAAEFLHQEYKDQSVWISVSGYSVASLIGLARIYNNKHWVSDVIAGAGVGILSTKIVYWTYPHLQELFNKDKQSNQSRVMIFPSYGDKTLSLNIACTF